MKLRLREVRTSHEPNRIQVQRLNRAIGAPSILEQLMYSSSRNT